MESMETAIGQEQCLEIRLRAKIAAGTWTPGQRLPAERQLAEEFGVSRNTLRCALRRLEAQRVVTIRRGSGCYLLSADCLQREVANEESFGKVMARFEAAYLFLPGMVALAARRITPNHLVLLEQCTAELGRAIVHKDREGIKDRTREFFRLIAVATANPVIGELVIPFCASSSVMFPEFFAFSEAERNKMFADIVYILHALKRHDAAGAMACMRGKIVNTSIAFSELKQVPLSPVIDSARTGIAQGG